MSIRDNPQQWLCVLGELYEPAHKPDVEFRDLARTGTHTTDHSTSAARTSGVADSGAERTDEGFWLAVPPFRYTGTSNADLVARAEGLTDDIVANMSTLSYLRVIARGSTAQYAQRVVDVRTAAKELGARFGVERSIRQAGVKIRISVQLVDTGTGAGLWAETYGRPIQSRGYARYSGRCYSPHSGRKGELSAKVRRVIRQVPRKGTSRCCWG
jgi:TolB-like protein